jgi:hypothetical protein
MVASEKVTHGPGQTRAIYRSSPFNGEEAPWSPAPGLQPVAECYPLRMNIGRASSALLLRPFCISNNFTAIKRLVLIRP